MVRCRIFIENFARKTISANFVFKKFVITFVKVYKMEPQTKMFNFTY